MRLVRPLYHWLIPQAMPRAAVDYYDRLIDGVTDTYLRPFAQEILTAYPGSARILDIGTGTGQLPVLLAKANPHYTLIGVDLSRKCVEMGRLRAEGAGLGKRVRFCEMDILRDVGMDESFDLVISTCSLHHWRWPVRMLRAAAGLLNEDGRIWIIDESADAKRDARREWMRRVESSGRPLWLFRTVFSFELKHLAYSRQEIETLCHRAGLRILDYVTREVFFQAILA